MRAKFRPQLIYRDKRRFYASKAMQLVMVDSGG